MNDSTQDLPDESSALEPGGSRFFAGIAWTPRIEEAAQIAALWINCDICGAAFWGLPRVGKSEFAKYFERVAAEMFGGTVVVVRLNFGGEPFKKQIELLRRCLSTVGVRASATRDPVVLRTRLMDEIWSRCTPATRRIVVIADEIQNVAPLLYGEFALMEAEISERYVPFLLCIGQPELQSTVANLEKNLHVMGRQFQELREFRGLSFEEIEEFLSSLDGEELGFSRQHFPSRVARGWSIVNLVEPLRLAINSVIDLDKMKLDLLFPMAYLRQTLNYLFYFLIEDENIEVTAATVADAFDRNGFRKVMMSYTKQQAAPRPTQE
jgi:hypothetical protein